MCYIYLFVLDARKAQNINDCPPFTSFLHHLTKSCEDFETCQGFVTNCFCFQQGTEGGSIWNTSLWLQARAALWSIWIFELLIPLNFSSSKARHPASHSVGYLCYLSAFTEAYWAHSCHLLLFPSLVHCSLGKVNVVTLSGARHRVFPFWEQSHVHCSHKKPYLSFCLVSF